jgi:hypothetical protein
MTGSTYLYYRKEYEGEEHEKAWAGKESYQGAL